VADPFIETPDGKDTAGQDTARRGVTGQDEVRQEDMVTYGNAGSDAVRQEGAGGGPARHAADTAAPPGGVTGEPGGLAESPGQGPGHGSAVTGEPAATGRTDIAGESGVIGEPDSANEFDVADEPDVSGELGGAGEDDFPGRERVEPMRPDGSATGPAGTPGALDGLGREPAGLAGARQGAEPAGFDSLANSPLTGDQAQVRQRWQEIQSTFVDDPRGSVTRAADLADTVVQSLIATVEERKATLRGAWDAGETGTEELRTALRSYRVLIDRLSSV
jgi:hypothetical protein